jgi:hypothetical protein
MARRFSGFSGFALSVCYCSGNGFSYQFNCKNLPDLLDLRDKKDQNNQEHET